MSDTYILQNLEDYFVLMKVLGLIFTVLFIFLSAALWHNTNIQDKTDTQEIHKALSKLH
jgi:hypothetical protein